MGPSRLIDASPAKLRDGTWGARALTPEVSEGDTLRVMSKSGKTWEAIVDRVLVRFDDGALVRTRKPDGDRDGCAMCNRSDLRPRRVERRCPYCGASRVFEP